MTKCSLVRPKVTKSVHYCPATKKSMERMYTDLTSLEAYPSSGAYPTKDEEGNPLETEYGLYTLPQVLNVFYKSFDLVCYLEFFRLKQVDI